MGLVGKRHLEQGLALGDELDVERKDRLFLGLGVKPGPRRDGLFFKGADPVHASSRILRELAKGVAPCGQWHWFLRLRNRHGRLDDRGLRLGFLRRLAPRRALIRLRGTILPGLRRSLEERREDTLPRLLAAAIKSHGTPHEHECQPEDPSAAHGR
jgi:hypothetical protein